MGDETVNSEEKVLVSKDLIKSMISSLKNIIASCNDKETKTKIEELLKTIQEELSEHCDSLEDQIKKAMRESKSINPELNASLYILYRKYVDKKIDEETALKMFESYLKSSQYDKMIY